MRALVLPVLLITGLAAAALAKDIAGTAADDSLHGTPEADHIRGLGGNDELFGFAGDDVLEGGDGHDEIFGGKGHDSMDGGAGDDFLDGRDGDDTITGGPGRDAFVYYAGTANGADVITDFDGAADELVLHGFATARLEFRAEGADIVIDLPGPDRVTLRGAVGFDPALVVYDVKEVVR